MTAPVKTTIPILGIVKLTLTEARVPLVQQTRQEILHCLQEADTREKSCQPYQRVVEPYYANPLSMA